MFEWLFRWFKKPIIQIVVVRKERLLNGFHGGEAYVDSKMIGTSIDNLPEPEQEDVKKFTLSVPLFTLGNINTEKRKNVVIIANNDLIPLTKNKRVKLQILNRLVDDYRVH